MIPKRVSDRLFRSIEKFQQILKNAKDRDVNEADTVSIIKDMLAEIFGYDKYLDITSEFSIRGTYCDLAIKIDNKLQFLIEVKAIGIDLKDSHLRQSIEYCSTSGNQWVVLTNGNTWQVHKVRFEQPIESDLICSFDVIDLDLKNEEHQEKLFILCKEGLVKDAREDFHEKIQTINRFILGALVLSDEIVGGLRRELRKISGGIMVSQEEISKVLSNEVLKRDTIEGDEATKAQARIRKYYGKLARRTKESSAPDEENFETEPVPSHEEENKP